MATRLERSRHHGADVWGRVRALAKGIGFSQLLILPPENGLHEFAGIGIGVGHWPVETFGHCQLPGGALLAEMAPQGDESADGTRTPTEPTDRAACRFLPDSRSGEVFGMLDEPFDENARFRVAQAP